MIAYGELFIEDNTNPKIVQFVGIMNVKSPRLSNIFQLNHLLNFRIFISKFVWFTIFYKNQVCLFNIEKNKKSMCTKFNTIWVILKIMSWAYLVIIWIEFGSKPNIYIRTSNQNLLFPILLLLSLNIFFSDQEIGSNKSKLIKPKLVFSFYKKTEVITKICLIALISWLGDFTSPNSYSVRFNDWIISSWYNIIVAFSVQPNAEFGVAHQITSRCLLMKIFWFFRFSKNAKSSW